MRGFHNSNFFVCQAVKLVHKPVYFFVGGGDLLSIHWCILCKKRSMSFFILPYARPKSTHQISPRVILYRLPHSAHRRMSRGKLFFLRNFVIYGVNTVNFRLIYIRAILIGTFFCKQQLNFFYIHYTVLLLYYTYWKCLNRRLSPETQSACAEI